MVTSSLVNGNQRIDWQAPAAGETYYVKLSGSSTQVDLRLANLVSKDATAVTVAGTDRADTFEFAPSGSYRVAINAVEYHFDEAAVASILFDGGPGADVAILTGSAADETVTLNPGSATMERPGLRVEVNDAATITVKSGGGGDVARLYDSDGDDALATLPDHTILSGAGFSNRADGFRFVFGYAETGSDTADLYDSPGDDTFTGTVDYGRLQGVTFDNTARSFKQVNLRGGHGGSDKATLYDSPGDDHLEAAGNWARLSYPERAILLSDLTSLALVKAISSLGGSDTKHVETIDFVLETEGPWIPV